MKTLKLKSFRYKNAKEDTHYKDMILGLLDNPREGGIKVSEIRVRLAIIDKLEKVEKELRLEDGEAEILKSIISETTWIKVDKGILQFNDDILAL